MILGLCTECSAQQDNSKFGNSWQRIRASHPLFFYKCSVLFHSQPFLLCRSFEREALLTVFFNRFCQGLVGLPSFTGQLDASVKWKQG
jgi:hypothetical protein